jgi:carnitine O-acetyltransferase
MFWGDEDLTGLVKSQASPAPLHRNETISVFGSTETVPTGTPTRSSDSPLPMAGALSDHQAAIPRLPVPPLEETCKLYLRSLEGLVNAEEYDKTEAKVEDFLKSGIGAHLQKLLQEHEARKEGPSWIEGYWDDAYLCTRDPVPININYYFGFMDHPKHATHGSQLGRAASLVHAAAELYLSIRDGQLSVDTERSQPLDMSQYRRVFCASRVPQIGRDKIITYTTATLLADEKLSHTSEYEKVSPKHIVVLARNRFFKVDIIDSQDEVMPTAAIVERLAFIVRTVMKDKTAGPPVGVLTAANRDDWAEARQQLVKLGNEANLVAIQSAIIVLVLDAVECETTDELARLLLHGTGTNRWFDRHNLIVSHNGRAGINFEHSVGDGAITLRVADSMYRADCEHALSNAEVEAIVQRVASSQEKLKDVQELMFRLDGLVDMRMKDSFEKFVELIRSNETTTMTFHQFGGDFIKKSGVSPDAFVQLAFQLTHYRLFGRCEATYEAASTRCFLHGRTEVVRAASRAAADFCEAAQQPVFARKIHSAVPSQIQLLRQAADAHVEYMKRAKAGKGVDRHFLGLRRMCAQYDINPPEIFTDPSFARSSHWILSTSHCGSSALSLFGFGPVVTDGFGLGYMIKNDSVSCCVTSKYTHRLLSSTIFANMLESSLLHMRSIIEADQEKRRKERPRSLDFVHPTSYNEFEYRAGAGFTYSVRTKSSLYRSTHTDPGSSPAMDSPSLSSPHK